VLPPYAGLADRRPQNQCEERLGKHTSEFRQHHGGAVVLSKYAITSISILRRREDCFLGRARWHLISNHGAALIYLAAQPSATIREAAEALGMSHRRTAGIVRELVDAGMLQIEKRGNHNHYQVNLTSPFPHPFLAALPVGLMLRPVVEALSSDAHHALEIDVQPTPALQTLELLREPATAALPRGGARSS
jgi:hypothetical protein